MAHFRADGHPGGTGVVLASTSSGTSFTSVLTVVAPVAGAAAGILNRQRASEAQQRSRQPIVQDEGAWNAVLVAQGQALTVAGDLLKQSRFYEQVLAEGRSRRDRYRPLAGELWQVKDENTLRRVREGLLGIDAVRRAQRSAARSRNVKSRFLESWLEPFFRFITVRRLRKAERFFVDNSYLQPQQGVKDRTVQQDGPGGSAQKPPAGTQSSPWSSLFRRRRPSLTQ